MVSSDAVSSRIAVYEAVAEGHPAKGNLRAVGSASSDQAPMAVKRSAPQGEESEVSASTDGAPVVVCFPGMGIESTYYEPFARGLAAEGYDVVLAELRGNGTSSVRASRQVNFGYYEMVHRDYPAIFDRVRARYPGRPIALLGHSLGGQLGALYVGVAKEPPDVLILIASSNVYFRGYDAPWKVLGGAAVLRAMGYVFGHVPGRRVGFGHREARNVIIDWSNNCLSGDYRLLNSAVDYHEKMAGVRLPVFALSFERDWMAPQAAVENLYRYLRSSVVTHHHVAADEPGFEAVNHFNWARRPGGVLNYLRPWMKERFSSRAPV